MGGGGPSGNEKYNKTKQSITKNQEPHKIGRGGGGYFIILYTVEVVKQKE